MMTRVIATHPPVELVDQRDDHTRVWEIVREVETTHPDGTTTVDTVKSHIHEKASGLCHKDATGNYVPSVAEWRETPDGFVIDRCTYGLSIGNKIGAGMGYNIEGHELALRAAYLMVSDGVNEAHLAVLDPDVEGFIVDGKPSVVTFPAAFGPGYDLEYVAEKGGFHQNLIIADCPELPEGFDPEKSAIYLYTEMNLDEYLAGSGLRVLADGEEIDARRDDLLTTQSGGGCISFCRPSRDAQKGNDIIHAFHASRVAGSPVAGSPPKHTIAEKRLLKTSSTGATYLVESLPFAYFVESSGLVYPVVWDYEQISEPISGDEWFPKNTYWVSSDISIEGILTILPGTTVKLNPSVDINIVTNGKLVAQGEPYRYITITNATDGGCGELITPPPPSGHFGFGFILSSDSSYESVIQYCKLGHGMCGICTYKSLGHTPEGVPRIAHNIIWDMSYYGIVVYGCSAHCHNNLIQGTYGSGHTSAGIYCQDAYYCSLTNNTIDSCYYGIMAYDSDYYYPVSATDNIFTDNVYYGIYANNPNLHFHHNRFCGGYGYFYGGTDLGENYGMYGVPYDPSCPGCPYFIDRSRFGELQNQGSRSAESAHLDGEEFSMLAPELVSGSYTSEGNEWGKMTDECRDTLEVDIGYHHNRIDYYLTDNCLVTSRVAASLDILPGTVVVFGGDETGQSRYLKAEKVGKIVSAGNPLSDDYNLFTRRKSVSMVIESPHYADTALGQLRLMGHADSRAAFCKFERGAGLYIASVNDPVESNRFALTYQGLYLGSSQPVQVVNNLFYWNHYGYYQLKSRVVVSNNTFDENDYGCELLLNYVGAPPYYSTLRDNLFTGNAVYAMEANVSSCSRFTEYSNAFFGNQYNLRINGVETQTDWNDILLAQYPYRSRYRGFRADWFLDQSGRAVDTGSVPSCDAGLRIYTTDYYGDLDEGQVDIGYHHSFDDSVVFVDGHNGSDANGDGSYTSPYETIEKGRDIAATTQGKSTVFVYPGPEQNGGAYRAYRYAADQSLNFDDTTPGSGLSFYGCGAGSCIIESVGTPVDENHPLVTIVNQSDMDLEGFTIRDRDNEIDGDDGYGGGVCCTNSHDISIRHCIIADNRADRGAGIYVENSHVVVEHCVIEHNFACSGQQGGGLYIQGGYPASAPTQWPEITECIISRNTAGDISDLSWQGGAGVRCVRSRPAITACIVANNQAKSQPPDDLVFRPGGGIYLHGAGTEEEPVLIERCAVVNNIAKDYGGIYVRWYEDQPPAGSYASIADSTITYNLAITDNGLAGGIRCEGRDDEDPYLASVQLTRCVFMNNTAGKEGQPGYGGGLSCDGWFSALLSSCLFVDNWASTGAGIWLGSDESYESSSARIMNCSIAGNEGPGAGLGIYNETTQFLPTIKNCIIYGHQLYDLFQCSATWSDIENPAEQGEGNIHEDPSFVTTAFGPYHIKYGYEDSELVYSDCLDRGYDIPELEQETDIDGNARKIDVVPPDGDHPDDMDMGSDEVHPFKRGLDIEKTGAPNYLITLTWVSEDGSPYEIYYSDESFRDGMAWTMAHQKIGSAGTTSWQDEIQNGDEHRQRFYRVKNVDENSAHYGIYTDAVGFINVPIAFSGDCSLISMPLVTKDDRINKGVGGMLGERLDGAGYENAHRLWIFIWNEQNRQYQEMELWLKNTPQGKKWVVGQEGEDPGDEYVVKPGEAIKLCVDSWQSNPPPVVTLRGYIPMERYHAQWIRLAGLNSGTRPWSSPYPVKTTLNDIPFIAFGAKGSSNPDEADRIKVLPIGEDQFTELYLDDKGIWRNLSGGHEASYDLVEVYPGRGFLYVQTIVQGVEEWERRYYVAKRPYCNGE